MIFGTPTNCTIICHENIENLLLRALQILVFARDLRHFCHLLHQTLLNPVLGENLADSLLHLLGRWRRRSIEDLLLERGQGAPHSGPPCRSALPTVPVRAQWAPATTSKTRRGHLNDILIGFPRPTHHYTRQQTKLESILLEPLSPNGNLYCGISVLQLRSKSQPHCFARSGPTLHHQCDHSHRNQTSDQLLTPAHTKFPPHGTCACCGVRGRRERNTWLDTGVLHHHVYCLEAFGDLLPELVWQLSHDIVRSSGWAGRRWLRAQLSLSPCQLLGSACGARHARSRTSTHAASASCHGLWPAAPPCAEVFFSAPRSLAGAQLA